MSEGVNKPFLLSPAGKDYLWGGTRLKDDFSKNINMTPLAETWECSTHPDGHSIVASGVYTGETLDYVLKRHPEFLGENAVYSGQLPILIKFIDAKLDLSVQVHPDDEYAMKYENGQLGKTEMWYVLDAKEGSSLVYGLNRDLSRQELETAVREGVLEKYLQKVPVNKNDIFYIEAGTIHAIGAGILVAEIQENSNLTYRLYDYNRQDKNGNTRELHLEKAVQVARLKASGSPRQPMRVLRYKPGIARELLAAGKYFECYRMLMNTERCRERAVYEPDEMSFKVLLCYEGCGTVECADGTSFCFFKGDCIFVPATAERLLLHGNAQFLDIKC